MNEIYEVCPHCGHENKLTASEGQMIATCAECGKAIVLCDKCTSINPNAEDRHCENCKFCDLANFMNYLRGFVTIEKFLGALNPPLVDMTTGLPEGIEGSLDDYLNDTYGDDVFWDVKYWDIYRLVKECFLNAESTEEECRDFVQAIIEKNNE